MLIKLFHWYNTHIIKKLNVVYTLLFYAAYTIVLEILSLYMLLDGLQFYSNLVLTYILLSMVTHSVLISIIEEMKHKEKQE